MCLFMMLSMVLTTLNIVAVCCTIAVKFHNKTVAVSEDCRATEAYGAPPRRQVNREPSGQHQPGHQRASGVRGPLDSLTEAGGSSRNTGPNVDSKPDAATSHLRK